MPLLDALASRDARIVPSIRVSLTRLLPQLQSSDAYRLLPRHITALNKDLDICRSWEWEDAGNVEYALAVFQALEKIGDENSVQVLEQISLTTRNGKVRDAAVACLPFLRERAALGKNTLLRVARSDTLDLLLPAHSGATSEPKVLLRPHTSREKV